MVHLVARGDGIRGLLKTTLPLDQVFRKRFVEGHASVQRNIIDSEIVAAFAICISKNLDLLQVVIPKSRCVHRNGFATF